MDFIFWDYLFAAVLGGLVGSVELITRYRTAPFQAATSAGGLVYAAINAAAALAALYLIQTFNWHMVQVGQDGDRQPQRVADVIAAGLGAMAVLRASLFNFRGTDATVPIGPGALMDAILKAADREIGRDQALDPIEFAAEVSSRIDFDKASQVLPAALFNALQGVSAKEQQELGKVILQIGANPAYTPENKSMQLILVLLPLAGEDLLQSVIDLLGDQITV